MEPQKFKQFLSDRHITQVILDFDQTVATLVMSDNWTIWSERIAKLFSTYDSSCADLRGRQLLRKANELMEKHGMELAHKMHRIIEEYEQEYFTGYEKNENLLEIIRSVNSCAWHIWSSNTLKTLKKALAEFGIENNIQKIASLDSVLKIKPDPEGFRFINSENLPLSSFLMIGDSEFDELAAKNSGIIFLHVSKI